MQTHIHTHTHPRIFVCLIVVTHAHTHTRWDLNNAINVETHIMRHDARDTLRERVASDEVAWDAKVYRHEFQTMHFVGKELDETSAPTRRDLRSRNKPPLRRNLSPDISTSLEHWRTELSERARLRLRLWRIASVTLRYGDVCNACTFTAIKHALTRACIVSTCTRRNAFARSLGGHSS